MCCVVHTRHTTEAQTADRQTDTLAKWPHTHPRRLNRELIANSGPVGSPWTQTHLRLLDTRFPQPTFSCSPPQLGCGNRYVRRCRQNIALSQDWRVKPLCIVKAQRQTSSGINRSLRATIRVFFAETSNRGVERTGFKVIDTEDITTAKRQLQVKARQPR